MLVLTGRLIRWDMGRMKTFYVFFNNKWANGRCVTVTANNKEEARSKIKARGLRNPDVIEEA